MSLFGALSAGVAGLNVQSNELGTISDNIANVSTIGYKETSATFQALVTSSGGTGEYTPGGVLGGSSSLVTTQGLLQTTTSPTDIAISGGGFFVTNQQPNGTGQVQYTRAGSFTQDSQGNFVNTAGLFLQAWPLDRNGDLPGAPGNLNTISAANLSSLQTVNVENLTGTASATTNVSLGANLNSSQTVLIGATGTITMDGLDVANSPVTGTDIIVPTAVDKIAAGNTINVSTGNNPSGFNYTYGGFTYGRDIHTGANGANGISTQPASVTLNTAIDPAANAFTTTASSGTINVTVPGPLGTTNMRDGQYVTIVGPSSPAMIDGIPAADFSGTFQINVVDGTHFSYTAASGGMATMGGVMAGAGSGAETVTPDPFLTTHSSKTITVDAPANGLTNGDVISFAGITAPGGTINGIPVAQLNTSFIVSGVTTDSYQITVATTAATTMGTNVPAQADAGTAVESVRPYAGNIFDADNASQALFGVTGTTNIDPNALSFIINTSASGPVKFTYESTDPNTSIGQFTTLNDLNTAINATPGLTSRISNNRLWVSATDATQGVTFQNVQQAASAGPPIKDGVNWIDELGLQTIAPAANRFNSLNSLAALINTSTGLTGAVVNPTGAATLNISVVNPTDTITFKDGTGSTGSLLSQFGLSTSLNSGALVLKTDGPKGPAYNPQVSATNMASGGIPPQFSYPVTVYDGLGTAHNLNVAFAKLQSNTWAVEIFAQPTTDVTASSATLVNGQVATGTLSFNGDGTLQNVSTSLTSPVTINWSNGSIQSNVTFNWGTAGQPAGTPGATQIGLTNGLSQFDSGYNVSFANQNGAPVGQLTGISINTSGYITASYSNGETQKLYKIPLASFTAPNLLAAGSGDAYSQSNASGIVNLKQPGASGVGTISASSLESSNADLAAQLTDMIVAQRAYQANSKVIQTANSLLSDLDQIIQ